MVENEESNQETLSMLEFMMLDNHSVKDLKCFLLNDTESDEQKSEILDMFRDNSILYVSNERLESRDFALEDANLEEELFEYKSELYENIPYELYRKFLNKIIRKFLGDFHDEIFNNTIEFSEYKTIASERETLLRGKFSRFNELTYLLCLKTNSPEEEEELLSLYKGFLKNPNYTITNKDNFVTDFRILLNPLAFSRFIQIILDEHENGSLGLFSNLNRSHININYVHAIKYIDKVEQYSLDEIENIYFNLMVLDALFRHLNVYQYGDFYKLARQNPIVFKGLLNRNLTVAKAFDFVEWYDIIDDSVIPLTQEEFQTYILPLFPNSRLGEHNQSVRTIPNNVQREGRNMNTRQTGSGQGRNGGSNGYNRQNQQNQRAVQGTARTGLGQATPLGGRTETVQPRTLEDIIRDRNRYTTQ